MRNFIRLFFSFLGFIMHNNRRSKIIYYHDVGNKYTQMGTPLSLIKAHLAIVRKSGFDLVDDINSADGQIMICFDDGWKGLYDNRDYFIEMNVFPTIFIAVDLIGKEGYMSISQINEMMALGFQFESHAWTHTSLHAHTGDDLKHELSDSKNWLERTFEKPFNSICFPQGNYNDEVIHESKRAGYSKLYSSTNGSYYETIDSNGLICRNLVQNASELQFRFIIKGDSQIIRNKRIKQHYHKS